MMVPPPISTRRRLALAGGTGLLAFLAFALPVVDGDAFWHVATGQWILEHRTLPKTDPLSFMTHVSPLPEAEATRVEFFLRQYWLAQVGMALAWRWFGHPALALLRMLAWALLLGGTTWWALERAPVRVALTLSALTATVLVEFPSERPQLASFVLLPLLVWLLDRRRDTSRAGWAPAVMLLWANLHGGFLIGLAATGVYLAGAVVRQVREPVAAGWQRPAMLALAMIAPGLNPSGFGVFAAVLGSSPELVGGNLEFLPPLVAGRELAIWIPAFWCVLAWAAASLATSIRRVPLETILIVVGTATLGLSALRFVPLFLGTVVVLAPWLAWPRWMPRWLPASVAMVALAPSLPSRGWPSVDVGKGFPVAAATFLNQPGAPVRLFNFYDWGGYLELTLPGARTFIDGRALVDAQSRLYDELLEARGWQAAFDRLGIDGAVLPAVSPHTGRLFPLVVGMLTHPAWHLRFADAEALVFARRPPGPTTDADLPRFLVHLRARLDALSARAHHRAEYWTSRALLEVNSGDREAAGRAVAEVLARKPNDPVALELSRHLSSTGQDLTGSGREDAGGLGPTGSIAK